MGLKLSRKFSCNRSAEKKDFESKYTLGNTLGSGSFGTIVEATQRHTFRTVAVKYIKKKNVETIVTVGTHKLPAEAVFLDSLQHPNVIRLVDLYQFKKRYAVVLERPLASLDLHHFVQKYGPQNDVVGAHIGKQILAACNYLHLNKIFHRDIKSENILISTYSNHIKLIDFGSATRITADIYFGDYGTPAFSPPEWITECGYRPEPTTIWSSGVVMFEVLTGALPFSDEDHVIRATLFFPDHISPSARDMLRKLLKRDDNDRPTFEESLEHPYFSSADTPEENQRILDASTYSKCSAYTIFENMNCNEYPLSMI